MLILLTTLLLTNIVVLLGIFAFPSIVKLLCFSHGDLRNTKLGLAGMRLAVATSTIVLNSLFLVVGGVALLTA